MVDPTEKFPLSTEHLKEWVPHRYPMVWIDEVLSSDDQGGECRISLSPEAHYNDGRHIRATSFIEWMAQSYAFVRACEAFMNHEARKVSEAYLVGLRDIEIFRAESPPSWKQELRVQVKLIRELGPIALIEGRVETWNHELLARGNLKLFGR